MTSLAKYGCFPCRLNFVFCLFEMITFEVIIWLEALVRSKNEGNLNLALSKLISEGKLDDAFCLTRWIRNEEDSNLNDSSMLI